MSCSVLILLVSLFVLIADILMNADAPALPVTSLASNGTSVDSIVGSRTGKMMPMHIR